MRPFRCLVTILNTKDHLGKFDGKADEGFFIGYSINSKAFRVFNSRTRIVKENMHVQFIVTGNQSNGNAGIKGCDDAGKARMEIEIMKKSDGNNTNNVNTVSSTVNTVGTDVNAISSNTSIKLPNDLNMSELEDIVYSDDYEDVGAEADMNNL
ncbi:retrovirus-related pol polyprotein from transposon TNT 1-94, partial [Tanacetum coccineum]